MINLYWVGDYQYYIDEKGYKWKRKYDFNKGNHGAWEKVIVTFV